MTDIFSNGLLLRSVYSTTPVHAIEMSSQQQPERRDLTNMQRSRYGLKMILYLGMVLLVSWALYMVVFARVPEQNDLDAARVVYSDIVQIQDLPTADITKKGKHRNPGRLIIVGDVHGMLHELTALLAKVQFDKNNDRLILAGDMIAKGPDSPGVVDLAMNLGAMAVRGNHEDRILVADARDVESKEKYHSKEHLSRKDDKDLALARTLGNERLQWLKKCPLILRLGKLGDMGEVVVVHAGLERGVKLQEQDPYMAMNMRTISASGVPSDKRKGEGWTKVPNLDVYWTIC